MSKSTLRRVIVIVGLTALFAGLASVALPPWSLMSTTLPVGRSLGVTVPLFNTWTIWWNCDRLAHGFDGYWDAPIFFPEQDTFAFSEPQPATLLVAPVLWASGSRILTYNVYLWLSLILNGLVCTWLLHRLGHRWWLAMAGGVGMLLLPLVHDQINVLQLIPLWGVLWTWGAVQRMGERPTWRSGSIAGLALGVSFALSIHHGLFTTILLAVPGLVLLRDWRNRRLYGAMLTGAIVASLMILPLVLPVRAALRAHEFERTQQRAAGLSARPANYLVLSDRCVLRPDWWGNQRFQLSPGWGKYALALAGVFAAFCRRRRRRWTLFLALTALLALALSLGPHLQVGGVRPWETIRDWCPGMTHVRNVFRFAYFFQMAILLLAIEGAHLLWLLARRMPARVCVRRATAVLVAGLSLVAAVETWPRRPDVAGTPSPAVNRGWIEFVQTHSKPGSGIACLPFATGASVRDFTETTRWMYLGTFHAVPLVNGYSGYFPASNETLRAVMADGFFTNEALDLLDEAGAQLIVVRTVLIEDRSSLGSAVTSGRLVHVFEDPRAGVNVFAAGRVGDDPPEARLPGRPRVVPANAQRSSSSE